MKNLKELFVPYELALMAKEKGFNEPCFRYYCKDNADRTGIKDWISNNLLDEVENSCIGLGNVAAPLYQQLVDWFREEHSIYIASYPIYRGEIIAFYKLDIAKIGESLDMSEIFGTTTDGWKTNTEALNAALTEAFKRID